MTFPDSQTGIPDPEVVPIPLVDLATTKRARAASSHPVWVYMSRG